MYKSTEFNGSIGWTWDEWKPCCPQPAKAPVDAPNITYIILDDVGYDWSSCYGGSTNTPHT